jgi:hypothetical protein
MSGRRRFAAPTNGRNCRKSRAGPPLRTGRLRAPAIALLIGGLALLSSLETNLARAQEAVSIFGSDLPSNAVAADYRGVTLGVKFFSLRAGKISAIRFYRGARSPVGYVARLYTASGGLLASATLATETGPIPGWQTATLPMPISISANTTYVAAYYATNGRYADDYLGLAKGRALGDLRVPGSSTIGGNGVYYYGLGFPRYEWKASNYYVDVLFTPVQQVPVLSLSFDPPNPSIPKTARGGTTVATVIARWSDGTPFSGTLAFGPPYWNAGGAFAISGNKLIVNPNGPGVAAGETTHVTIVATQ